jgi:hypothetical protein
MAIISAVFPGCVSSFACCLILCFRSNTAIFSFIVSFLPVNFRMSFIFNDAMMRSAFGDGGIEIKGWIVSETTGSAKDEKPGKRAIKKNIFLIEAGLVIKCNFLILYPQMINPISIFALLHADKTIFSADI